MTSVSPRAADRIRKAVAFVLAGLGTWLLMRVLFRLAKGEQTLGDWELWLFVLIGLVAVLWIRAARPVRRRASER